MQRRLPNDITRRLNAFSAEEDAYLGTRTVRLTHAVRPLLRRTGERLPSLTDAVRSILYVNAPATVTGDAAPRTLITASAERVRGVSPITPHREAVGGGAMHEIDVKVAAVTPHVLPPSRTESEPSGEKPTPLNVISVPPSALPADGPAAAPTTRG